MPDEPRLDVKPVAFGRPAGLALAEWLAATKGDDPLAPATVVVPSNFAGLSMRRLLASGVLDQPQARAGGARGIANVSFDTLYGVAARLGAPALARRGLKPLTNPVLGATIRRVLAGDKGYFAPVARHPSTEVALLRVYGELSRCLPETLDRLARSPQRRTREVLRLFNEVKALLGDRYGEDDLASAAVEAVSDPVPDAAAIAEGLGPVNLFLPGDLTPAMRALVRALAGVVPVEVLVGITGVGEADRRVIELAESFGGPVDAAEVTVPFATSMISVADTDEEVRAVVRELMVRAERGTPLNRIGVLYPRGEQYCRLVNEHLDAAGIPHNAPSGRSLSGSVAGRVLLALLALPAAGLARDDVIDLLAEAPVLGEDGRIVPAGAWDTISRRAGVLAGAPDWQTKLDRYRAQLQERLQATGADQSSAASRRHYRSRIELTAALGRFVAGLARKLDPTSIPRTWRGMSAWAHDAMLGLLGPAATRSGWEEAELEAYEGVQGALERLAALDLVEPGPTLETFAHAVVDELDSPMPRRGRFGEGVVCGPLSMAPGLDVDVIFVVGMTEGTCPAPRRESSLLPDRERRCAVSGELVLQAEQIHVEHRFFLAALASGLDERVLVYGRGDERTGRQRLVSRWVLDSMASHAGRRVYSSEVADLTLPSVAVVESYLAGVRQAATPASVTDHDLGSLLRHTEAGEELHLHPLVGCEPLSAALATIEARSSSSFTSYDGNLAGTGISGPADSTLTAATRLERWASCPFSYFLGDVLGLGELAKPERIFEIDPLERGGLIHEILERFFRLVLERPAEERPAPDQGWSDDERELLLELAQECFAAREARGVTGRSLLWRLHQADMLTDLLAFLDADEQLRRELRAVPEAVELPFGIDGEEPATLTLPDGRLISFRGYADRVDLAADGSPVVLDYKTGKPDSYMEVLDDPVAGGTRLQLPVYAEASRQRYGSDLARVFYWFVSRKGRFELLGYEYDRARRQRFVEVVSRIADGIASGLFPPNPGPWNWFHDTNANCTYCVFDRLCVRARFEQAEAKRSAPELSPYLELIESEA
ncbi:MAG: ATP-dependent helicase/deoxyribonuclease subunit B [Acidimicrobiales bacterium]|nr:MAG: PD-(D/E)XK nuclease family protein [Actinomycetota bacterium]MBV6509481.1 ATP-dependent helicase/deoxyribonuclease subunit B [Acidimicrobiales bacterium]RIK06795.1 MAG: hypothetical protein DCC48_06125 [Acidobacteriota bacterium]